MCRGRRARILLHLHIQREKIVLRGSRAGRRFGCRNNPSCVYVLGRTTRGGEGRARILLNLHIQREKIVLRGSRAGRRSGCRNNPSCVYVLGRRTRGGETGAPLDLKMPLEDGRPDKRVSRGQASERAVCVCEAVSVEKGARRPPLPTAVVCTPGRRRRRRLAIRPCFSLLP
jgi:ssDNA-binding Zn-finger/Zn-ribbon topoisomerase 1